jgi:hypothetical protein
MKYADGFYEFRFDRNGQKVAAPFFVDDEDVITVRIPGKNLLNPEYMADKYNLRYESVLSSTDFEIMVDQDLLARRLDGELPKIEIFGKEYSADYKHGRISPPEEGYPHLFLPAGFNCQNPITLYYDLKENRQTSADTLTKNYIEDNLLCVYLPPPLQVDPVFTAEDKGWDLQTTLLNHPITDKITAGYTVPANMAFKLGKLRTKQRFSSASKKKRKGLN